MMRRLRQRQRQQRSIFGMLSNHSKTGLSKKEVEFLKAYGLKKAREVVEGAPELSLFYDLEKGKHVLKENTSIAMAFLKNRFLPIEDLKRLVESVDLVNSLGGIKAARSEAHKDCFVYNQPLQAAIAAYESIYGGGEYHAN